MIRKSFAFGAVAAVSLGLASSASAQTPQVVTATALPTLGLTVPGPVTIAGLQQGTNTFTTTPLAVVAPLGNWGLTVSDATNGGKLKAAAAGCDGSDGFLDNALDFTANTTIAAGETGSGTVGSTAQTVLSTVNSLADTANVTYSVDVPADQQLKTGCVYSTQLSYTLTG